MGRAPGSKNKPSKEEKPSKTTPKADAAPAPEETVAPPVVEETHETVEPETEAFPGTDETITDETITEETVTESVQNEADSAPLVETAPAAPVANVAPVQAVAPVEAETPVAAVTPPTNLSKVKPTSAHTDAEKMEAFMEIRKNPKQIGHIELMASGINMMKMGLLEGKIGKYSFTRRYIAEAWTISID